MEKTAIEIFKKYGAHYYENDEQDIVDAMNEYSQREAIVFLKFREEKCSYFGLWNDKPAYICMTSDKKMDTEQLYQSQEFKLFKQQTT